MEKYQNFINQIKQLQETCQHKDNWNYYEALRIDWIIDALKDDDLAYADILLHALIITKNILKFLASVANLQTNKNEQLLYL